MKKTTKYLIVIIFTFILYGNTLFNDYTLDDAIVIYENEYTLNGFKGIKSIISEDSFNGFFEEKDKQLVSGGRYRPLSIITFAVEWQVIMATPFKNINELRLKKNLDKNANPKRILPSQKLLKELTKTIYIENGNLRQKRQDRIINDTQIFTSTEKAIVFSNLERMYNKKGLVLFVSHLINVLLFALTALVLLVLLEKLLVNFKADNWYLSIPFLATLIFIAHPIHTEVVANIKGRDEILSLLGALSAMYFVFKYLDKQKSYFLILSFLFFLIGIFSKEIAVTFLAIVPLSIYFFSRDNNLIKKILVSIIPLSLAVIIYFVVRHMVLGDLSFKPSTELMNNSFLGMNFSDKYATIFYTLILYVKLLIFPHPLTYDYYPYHISIMTWTNIWPVVSLVFYLLLGVYVLVKFKKKSVISFGILLYIIALSPTSNILFPIGVFMNERFVYAASIGFVIILAYIISVKIPVWIKNKNASISILIIILALYSIKTISRNKDWENDFTLFTHDVKISTNSAKSNTSAGGKLIEEAVKPENRKLRSDYLNQAIVYLRKAIKIHPKYIDAYLLMGNAQWELYNNLDSTYKYYGQILKLNPRYSQVYTNIFDTKINSIFDDAAKAKSNIIILHQLEKFNPNYFQINYYLGRIYGRYFNDLNTAKIYLERAAKINPNNIAVFKDLGVAYGMTKEFEKSAQALLKAIELESLDPILKLNLAMTYANLKNYKQALLWMDNVFQMPLKKKDAKVLVNLAYLYRNMGKPQKAQECVAKAKILNPELIIK